MFLGARECRRELKEKGMMKKTWLLFVIFLISLVGLAVSDSSAAAEKKPFGGDTCKALTAEDLAKIHFKITSTLKPVPNQCVYQLEGTYTTALSVFLDDAKVFDINRGIYAPVTAVSGVGDEAYTGHVSSSHIIAVKAKGTYFRIDVESSHFTLDDLKQLAQAVIDKL
jgi:hypothetical protein